MIDFILQKRMIFWNIVLLIFVKIIFPQTSFQLANILGQIPQLDSREIISLTNDIRSKNGLGLLNPSFQLDLAASEKLNDMVKNSYFAHISPEGITPWYWIDKSSYNYIAAGENLAIGFFTADDTLKAWLNSPPHKANLLGPNYRDIGVAVGRGKLNSTEGIIVVQMFGSQKTKTPILAKAAPTPSIPNISPIQNILTTLPVSSPGIVESLTPESSVLPAEIKLKYNIQEIPKNQPLSTDNKVESLTEPIKLAMKSQDKSNIEGPIRTVNSIFIAYSFVFAAITLFFLFKFDQKKMIAFQAFSHTAILILALTIPSASKALETLIF